MIGNIIPLSCGYRRTRREMKYAELIRKLKRAGCYDIGLQQAGHPLWYSPKTGKTFQLSNHTGQEVAVGTLRKILKAAGIG